MVILWNKKREYIGFMNHDYLMIKSLFRLSLRMITGFVQSLIKLCGLDWTAPDYSTICRRQKHIDIAISYQKSRDGLPCAVYCSSLTLLV